MYEVPQPMESVLTTKQQTESKRRYLPGEKLLKKLSRQEEKKKPLDLRMLERSISDILDVF